MSFHAADWKRLISGLAPMLGTALGGPLVGEAISAIGGALLGKPDATPAEVVEAASAGQLSTEQIVALKMAEQQFKATMKDKDIDLAKLNAAADAAMVVDTADARRVFNTNDSVFVLGVWILCVFAFLMFVVLLGCFLLISGAVHAEATTLAVAAGIIGSVVGYAASNAQQVISFYYGSSKGSKDAGAQLGATLTEVMKKQGIVATNDENALKGRPPREAP